jgi:hypothetical protein
LAWEVQMAQATLPKMSIRIYPMPSCRSRNDRWPSTAPSVHGYFGLLRSHGPEREHA